jgi:hypothetical protein
VARATAAFAAAVRRAGLPPWPVDGVEVLREDDEPGFLA